MLSERVPHLGCPNSSLANSKIKQAHSYAEAQQAQPASGNIGGTKEHSPKNAVVHGCSMHCFNTSACIEYIINTVNIYHVKLRGILLAVYWVG